jgi:hypothetical protein
MDDKSGRQLKPTARAPTVYGCRRLEHDYQVGFDYLRQCARDRGGQDEPWLCPESRAFRHRDRGSGVLPVRDGPQKRSNKLIAHVHDVIGTVIPSVKGLIIGGDFNNPNRSPFGHG